MRDDEGLLEKIADTALDDDYYVVRSGPDDASHRFNTVLTGLVLAAFAVLVSVAAVQTRSERPAAERARESLIEDIGSRKAVLADREKRAAALRKEVATLRTSVVGANAELDELRTLASGRAVRGPGLRVVTSPGPAGDITDRDLQQLVNGFWYAGAEAVSVNGQRVGPLTAIRQAGGVVKVNYRSIGPPYTIVVLGDADSLQERFEQSAVGRDWLQRRKDAGGQFDVTGSDDLSAKAVPQDRLTIRHATATKGDS